LGQLPGDATGGSIALCRTKCAAPGREPRKSELKTLLGSAPDLRGASASGHFREAEAWQIDLPEKSGFAPRKGSGRTHVGRHEHGRRRCGAGTPRAVCRPGMRMAELENELSGWASEGRERLIPYIADAKGFFLQFHELS